MKKAIIEFKNFSFQYDAQASPTLNNINLSIYQGEKVLIIGPSGSGKSTLGYCLNGLVPNIYTGSVKGELLIEGEPVFSLSIYDRSNTISTILQDTDSQFIGLSVAEDLAFILENDMVDLPDMKAKINYWAQKLDLVNLLRHRLPDLSGGQKQRVSLAGVLIDESPVLLFDEPLANLDPRSGKDTIELIDRIHKEDSITTLIIEHRLEDVLHRTVDRIILINGGEILFNGRPDDILRTELLTQHGIREPLYITTLRHLGFDVTSQLHLSNLEALDLRHSTFSSEESLQRNMTCKGEDLLTIQGISFSYSTKSVLKNINLTIKKGEKISIVGKNGAGKSTLARCLCQFVTAEGEFIWRGQLANRDSIKERAEKIGYVSQNPNQMISCSMIFDEVASGLLLRGFDSDSVRTMVFKVLKICGLYEFRNWPISALSFGQKKRVTIASILVLNPEIILLDEPTAGQDQRHYTEILDFLDTLYQKGHTIIMITHDMQLMLDYSNRTIVLDDGKVLADTSPEKVLTNTELIKRANLKETSVFHLAKKLGLDPLALTRFYMTRRKKKYV